MPAASTKPDKASPEAVDPIKQVLMVVEKKVRNLEKRKGKLDSYKAKEESGETLEKDQQLAVKKYEEVVQNLEFARELQKQFQGISVDAEKMMKKQMKRDKLERQNLVLKRLQELLSVQNLLDSMGSEKVRADFQSGKHGAIVLTEENLNQLDELYKLISPSRDGESNYQEQLNQSSEHILSLLDAKEKEVAGTTYKDLKELIDLINNCGYFENAMASEEEEETVQPEVTQDYTVETEELTESSEVQASIPPQTIIEQQQQQQTINEPSQNTQPDYNTPAEADSFFSKTAPVSATEASLGVAPVQQSQQQHTQQQPEETYQQKPFQDIVSSVQGNFNFLQESTIDMESPHMDPAVVAAHPMPPAPLGHSAESATLTSQTFSNQGFGDLQQQSLDSTPTNTQSEPSQSSLLSQQQQSVSALSGPQDFTSQTFGQSPLSQSLPSDSLFQSSGVEDNNSQLSQSVLGQTGDSTISQFDMPPPALPMPPGHESNPQESSSSESQAEKKFTMNPNAQMFQSQIYNQQSDFNQQSQQQQQQQGGDYNRQGSYQGNNYQSGGYRGGNRGGSGGGFRGKSNRGGMSNGFSGGRGGRGGYGGSGGGNRGFQGGFQSREYRNDGYQSYNGNFGSNNNNGFQKRGGFNSRGGNRGGSGGAMRGSGGPNRGGPRGGSRGGTNTGGFGRPNMAPQQQTA